MDKGLLTDAKDDLNAHVLEIPLSSNGSAKWTIRAASVKRLVEELTAAEAAIVRIAQLAGRIVSVTCGAPVEHKGDRS